MKYCVTFILFMLLFSCCRSPHQADQLLDQAGKLVYSDPEQALKLLDSVSPSSLKRSSRYQLYLLKIHAAYEANQDISKYPPLYNTARYFQQQGDSAKASRAYLFTGIMDSKIGYYERASINLSEAEENAPQKDSMLLFQIHYHRGKLYELRHDHQAGAEAYQEAIRYHSSGDQYNDYEMGDCLLYTKQYTAARAYYKKAEQNALNLQDSVNVAYLMLQIGISYSKTQTMANAILYAHQALRYDPDPEFQKQGYLLLSEIHFNYRQLDSTRYYLGKISLSADNSEKLQALYYKQLYQVTELEKDYRSALDYYKKYTTYITDYQQDKTEERIDNIVNRYHKKKWQHENHILIRQRTLLVTGTLILILLFILIVTYIGILLKKRREKYLNACQMIETLQHLYLEQNRCQDKFKELLLNKLEISKKLAFISGYPHDKHQAFLKMYNEILGELGQTDLNWDELYFTINYLYNNFQQKLKDKYPALSEKEIQLCCLLRGGFKTDEIAFVVRQSVYSIYKRKTVIRKKLGMDERADILTILLSLLNNS